MKRYFFSSIALLIFGAIVFGAGYVLYDKGDNKVFDSYLEYTDMEYTAQSDVSAVDLDLEGAYNVKLQKQECGSISYAQCEISDITVEEENGVLKLKEKVDWKKRAKKWYCRRQKTDMVIALPEEKISSLKLDISDNVSVELPDWEYGDIELNVSGATELKSTSLKAESVSLTVSGAASIYLNGEIQNMHVKSSGASDITINGSINSLEINSSGSVAFNSQDLNCSQIDLKSSGTARFNIEGEGDSLSAKVSGHCNINAEKFALNTLNIDASGAAKMRVNVVEKITAKVSGSVKVEYLGDPIIDRTGSGSNKFEKIG